MRWAKYLSNYDYDIIFRAGKENVIADYLSRNFINLILDEFVNSYEDEREMARKRNHIFILPDKRYDLLSRTHRVATGHLKEIKFIQFLEKRYYWKDLKRDARNFVKKCDVCARLNNAIGYKPITPIKTNYPFEMVAMDIGQINIENKEGLVKQLYFIIAIDLFTKWVEVDVIKAQTSENVKQFILQHIVYRHGCPAIIRSDNGPGFVSAAISEFYDDYQIHQSTSAPFHPESNGAAERFIRTLKQILKGFKLEAPRDLKRFLNIAASAYRMVPHRSNGISPFVMMYGREPIMPEEINFIKFKEIEDYNRAVFNHIQNLLEIHELALNRQKIYVEGMKRQFNLKKVGTREVTDFKVGDLVWINVHRRLKSKGKGGLHWEGPCEIVEKSLGGLFNLEYKTGISTVKFNRIHPQFLKPFRGESS